MEMSSGVRNHDESTSCRAGTSVIILRVRPVGGTIAVASGGYPGNIGARRRSAHRGNSLAPANARKAVARSPAHRHEGARHARLVPGSMRSGTHHSGTTEPPAKRHNTGPAPRGNRAGTVQLREERRQWRTPSAGISASAQATSGASKPSPRRATPAPTGSSSSSPSRPSTGASGPGTSSKSSYYALRCSPPRLSHAT